MRPRKPSKIDAVVQVNLRIDEELRRLLERTADTHRATFSQEVRARLAGSFDTKPLWNLLDDFERQAGDILERNARNSKDKNIADTFRRRATLGATLRKAYADVEQLLALDMHDPELRKLMRGTPQEREKGGKS